MKKALLAFCAAFALAGMLYAGGDTAKDSKAVMQPSPVTPQWYADKEWNVSLWGTYVFTENNGGPEVVREEAPWDSDRYLGADDAWGGGLDLKYFFHRYFGVGIEGFGLAVHRSAPNLVEVQVGTSGMEFTPQSEDKAIGSLLGTFTFRYPIGRFAPYLFVGGGLLFGGGDVQYFELTGATGGGYAYAEAYRRGDSTAAVGQIGGGLEMRVTPHIGVLSDFSWNVVEGSKNDFGMVRGGINFAF